MSGSAPFQFGRYRLLERIGEGGMAEVWKGVLAGAHDFERVVVVKRILPELSANPDFTAMFTREALLSARLEHPNIVQVFEFSSVEGRLFLAMELVDGVNLIEVMRARRGGEPPPVGFAAHVVHEVCRALAYAHALADEDGRPLRLVHRDVTPSNIMVARDGVVKLLDFGIAKALAVTDDRTRTGSLKGKLGYLSPELVDGEVEIDQRADLFAAGVVLHELLTGRRLFKGSDDLRTLALVRACRVAPPSSLRLDVPPALDRICLRALARDRDERYADAGAMAAALSDVVHELGWDQTGSERFLAGEELMRTVDTRPSEPSATTVDRPPRRRRLAAGLLAATAAVATAIVVRLAHRDVPVVAPPVLVAPVSVPPPAPDDTTRTRAAVVAPARVRSPHHATRPTAPRIKDVAAGEIVNPFGKK